MPTREFRIEYVSSKIFRNEKDYKKRGKASTTFDLVDDSGIVYLDDIERQIKAASEGGQVKGVGFKTDYLLDGKVVKKWYEGDGVKPVHSLVVKYKGDVNKIKIPDDLKKKLQIQEGDG